MKFLLYNISQIVVVLYGFFDGKVLALQLGFVGSVALNAIMGIDVVNDGMFEP
jgi:hypothetical protein